MKRKIGAPKGRQLYGAPKGAPIMPNMVVWVYTLNYGAKYFVSTSCSQRHRPNQSAHKDWLGHPKKPI